MVISAKAVRVLCNTKPLVTLKSKVLIGAAVGVLPKSRVKVLSRRPHFDRKEH